MAEFVKVAKTSEIPVGTRYWVEFEEETIVIFNINGAYYAIADLCTHDDGPLEDGTLSGHEIECPRHGARFDVRSGKALCLPATTPVPTYQTKVVGEDLYVESPDTYWQ
ncbi:MAG: non-heme iron oxygenase ferredoxin subunit [Candidatus Promineifilaceae bacterium]|nr:non-heme iron oxygenase ferredoxin subunit [Candidatus Promineifilaceae bacterium]